MNDSDQFAARARELSAKAGPRGGLAYFAVLALTYQVGALVSFSNRSDLPALVGRGLALIGLALSVVAIWRRHQPLFRQEAPGVRTSAIAMFLLPVVALWLSGRMEWYYLVLLLFPIERAVAAVGPAATGT